jgi:maltose alpha-D-glucosyltransferase/alpha-amylase
MQWTPEANGGFTIAAAETPAIPPITDPQYGAAVRNVSLLQQDPGSLLNWIRHLLTTRRLHPEMGRGSFRMVDPTNPAVLAFVRELEENATLVLANFSAETQEAKIAAEDLGHRLPVDAVTGERLPRLGTDPLRLQLGALEFSWLRLHGGAERPGDTSASPPP